MKYGQTLSFVKYLQLNHQFDVMVLGEIWVDMDISFSISGSILIKNNCTVRNNNKNLILSCNSLEISFSWDKYLYYLGTIYMNITK